MTSHATSTIRTLVTFTSLILIVVVLGASYLSVNKPIQQRAMVRTNTTLVYEFPMKGTTLLNTARKSFYLASGNITIELRIIKPIPAGGYLPLMLQNDTLQPTSIGWVQPIIWEFNITKSENITLRILRSGWYTVSLIGPVYYNEPKSSSGGMYRTSGWGAQFTGSEIRVEAGIWVSEETALTFKTRIYP